MAPSRFTQARRPASTALGAVLIAIVAALLAAAPALAANYSVVSGYTDFTIAPATLQPLEVSGLVLYPWGAARVTVSSTTLTIREPVTSGTWSTTSKAGTLRHSGGMVFVRPLTGFGWYAVLWSKLNVTLGKAPYTMALFNESASQQVFDVTGSVTQKVYLKNGHRYVRITGIALPITDTGASDLKLFIGSAPIAAGQDFVATMTTVVRVK